MQRPVAVLDPYWRQMDELFSAKEAAALQELCTVVWGKDAPIPDDVLGEGLSRAEFLISCSPVVTAKTLEGAPKLKAVIEVGGVFPDSIDYGACFARGIEILSGSPGFRESVAEMALGLALAGSRGVVSEHEAFRTGHEHWLEDNAATDFSLFDQEIGFIGFGSIAREIARLLMPFRPILRAFDPWASVEAAQACNAELSDLDMILSKSRCLFIAAAPTHENKGMIDAAALAKLPEAALVVLVSRAHLVDFDALLAFAAAGRIRAAIDVFPEEPLSADHPARSNAGVILSPHRAAAIKGGRQLIGRLVLRDLHAMIAGGKPAALLRAGPEHINQLAGVQSSSSVAKMASGRRSAEQEQGR